MTWTAAPEAVVTFRQLQNACQTNIPGQNTVLYRGKTYCFEPDYVTHPDGAITGEIHRFDRDNNVVETKPFHIDPSGKIQADYVLRQIRKRAMKQSGGCD
ncbi:MAG: hypothetical protein PHR28_04920 [candidate division Zixibacteria bacterium]|jgi:hypothetical protein|nr:hypothetical protein [candidate division Zixibacteria bacterium]